MRPRLIILTLLATLLFYSAVSAHEATFLKSTPINGAIVAESPTQVRVWFEEELETGESKLQVFNAAGQRMDAGDGGVDLTDPDHASMVVNLQNLPEGEYLVRWHVLLLDGDASESVFNFFVGDEEAASAVGFSPADTTILYYQLDEETESGPWLMIGIGTAILIALLLPIFIILRRRT